MKRKFPVRKALWLLIPLLLLAILCEPFLSAWLCNQSLDISGVKLLMTKAEVDRVLGEEGIELGGMGAEFYRYEKAQITVSLPYDGLFSGRVGSIDTSNPQHSLFGVQVGSTKETYINKLRWNGFRKAVPDEDFYKRGSAVVSLYGSQIRISLRDWTLMGRVY